MTNLEKEASKVRTVVLSDIVTVRTITQSIVRLLALQTYKCLSGTTVTWPHCDVALHLRRLHVCACFLCAYLMSRVD